jgi:hypothetical protein
VSPLEEGLSKYDYFFDAEPQYDTLDAPSHEPISAPIPEPAPPLAWSDPASAPTEEPAAPTFPSIDEPPPLDPPAPTFTAYDEPPLSFDAPPIRATPEPPAPPPAPAFVPPPPPVPAFVPPVPAFVPPPPPAPPLAEAPTGPGPEPLGVWAPPFTVEEEYEDRPTQPIAEADWSTEEEPWVASVELEEGPSAVPPPTPVPESSSPEEPLSRSWFADAEPHEQTYDDADDGPVLIAPAEAPAGEEVEARRIPLSNESIFVLSLLVGMMTGALVLFGLGSLLLSAVRNF